jgi:hypothetical protein
MKCPVLKNYKCYLILIAVKICWNMYKITVDSIWRSSLCLQLNKLIQQTSSYDKTAVFCAFRRTDPASSLRSNVLPNDTYTGEIVGMFPFSNLLIRLDKSVPFILSSSGFWYQVHNCILKQDSACSSGTLVTAWQSTRCHNTNLHRCGNLNSESVQNVPWGESRRDPCWSL